jgi:hypothetical protein
MTANADFYGDDAEDIQYLDSLDSRVTVWDVTSRNWRTLRLPLTTTTTPVTFTQMSPSPRDH